MTTPRIVQCATAALVVLTVSALAACSPTAAGSGAPDSATPSTAKAAGPTMGAPQLVDVGGHRLYLSCTGTGSPTVVFIHGFVMDDAYVPHENIGSINRLLADDFRVCAYDRRNVGSSETVDAVQTPDDMLRDMEGVLANGGVEPPYILLAGSFGGLPAYDFLMHHPDQVVGMVSLDTMIPDELALDQYLQEGDTFLHYREDDTCCQPERISQYDLITGLQQYIGHEPAIPMIYLAASREPRVEYTWATPEYAARYPAVLQAFVDRFSPGELRWVDSDHGGMNDLASEEIADAVRDVAQMASTHE